MWHLFALYFTGWCISMATTIMTDLAANTSDKLLNETLIAYDKQNWERHEHNVKLK